MYLSVLAWVEEMRGRSKNYQMIKRCDNIPKSRHLLSLLGAEVKPKVECVSIPHRGFPDGAKHWLKDEVPDFDEAEEWVIRSWMTPGELIGIMEQYTNMRDEYALRLDDAYNVMWDIADGAERRQKQGVSIRITYGIF